MGGHVMVSPSVGRCTKIALCALVASAAYTLISNGFAYWDFDEDEYFAGSYSSDSLHTYATTRRFDGKSISVGEWTNTSQQRNGRGNKDGFSVREWPAVGKKKVAFGRWNRTRGRNDTRNHSAFGQWSSDMEIVEGKK